MTKNQKISQTLKKHWETHEHHATGKPGWKHSDEMKELKRKRVIEHYDKVGRMPDAVKRAKNKANVYAYRARKRNAIPPDADLKLISRIYENCPEGYHVDHIVALASGGQHHQDNLQYLPISENCRKGKDRPYDSSLAKDWRQFIAQ
jgi:RAB protein geranylgeranyltransferase component A